VSPSEPLLVLPSEPLLVSPSEPLLVSPSEPLLVLPSEPLLVLPSEPLLVLFGYLGLRHHMIYLSQLSLLAFHICLPPKTPSCMTTVMIR
jgi:hypothetical protein